MSHIFLLIPIVIIFLVLLVLFVRRIKMRNHFNDENKQLYIGNLPYQTNAYHLREFFSQYGEVAHIRLIKNPRTGRSKGFAFITFAQAKDAKNALSANGQQMRGRTIVVRISKQRD